MATNHLSYTLPNWELCALVDLLHHMEQLWGMNKIQLQWNGWYKLLQLCIPLGKLLAIKEGYKLAETSDCIPVISEARKDPLSTLHLERLLFLVAAFTVCISRWNGKSSGGLVFSQPRWLWPFLSSGACFLSIYACGLGSRVALEDWIMKLVATGIYFWSPHPPKREKVKNSPF